MIRAWLFLVSAVSLTGCISPQDPGCVSDNECYAGRLCVDGRCTGEVAVNGLPNNDPHNAESNNVPSNAQPNNEPRNAEPNNRPRNNEPRNNEPRNNVQNNQNNRPELCETADDCAREQVCTNDPSGTICVEPWSCDRAIDSPPDFCTAEFYCEGEGGDYQLWCEFGDRDDGFCICTDLQTGVAQEFEAPSFLCDDVDGLVDRVNLECGWRVGRF